MRPLCIANGSDQKYQRLEVPMRWGRPARWLPLIYFLATFYLVVLLLSHFGDGISPLQMLPQRTKLKSDYDYPHEGVTVKKFTLILNSTRYPEPMEIESVLTDDKIATFEERLLPSVDYKAPAKIILSWDAGHGPENLGGCPDWNCLFTYDRAKADQASVILTSSDEFQRRSREQILAFYSQESPKNMPTRAPKAYYNVSLGFRHDTGGASPYGYTVKLAKRKSIGEVVNSSRLEGKTKGAAWFVSHCNTNSRREDLVTKMQKYFPVDIYGHCLNGANCPRGEKCEDMLDDDYHFYLAFENSICTDYITEKVWNQGYGRDIVPVVLKRSIAHNRLPPNSFIAADDYDTVQDLADRMQYLIKNKTAYSAKIKEHCSEMFHWRRDYTTIYLNGEQHDILERPWGFCQLCRMAWESPKKERVIDDFRHWWEESCEEDGATVAKMLSHTEARENEKEKMLRANRISVT
ncbi:fut-1 [Pristionchus pacificus]|uniref:Fucosyltransferase n=1 Tax=Pristionchus pacificus TaxID=54126 RepID=A0A2A6B603_PRIPA|nr:fut-1 [Pristionchus pacificus]|eukprot:PDM61307.1 fut-1 [Pristionchus pacificus]